MHFPPLPRCGPIPWCKVLSLLVLLVVLPVTLRYLLGLACSTQNYFNNIDAEIYKIKEEMQQLKGNGKTSDGVQQMSCQKVAGVQKSLSEYKSCSANSDSEEECCSLFGSSDDTSSSAGRADFALESSGGRIISTGDTVQLDPGSPSLFGIPVCCSRNGPGAVIQANVQPGECWAFKGCEGTVTIKLLGYVYISGVSLEHIPKSISPSGNINSAPRDFCILGLENESDTEGESFGEFTYNSDGPPLQYFAIDACSQSYEIIQMQINSNHGNPDFTCIYILQVHGKLDEDKTLKLDGQ